jgi:hypothetical protein
MPGVTVLNPATEQPAAMVAQPAAAVRAPDTGSRRLNVTFHEPVGRQGN